MAISIPNTINTADYIIYQTGTTIAALNGTTGNIDFQGTNAATVINSAINNLPTGGLIHMKAGDYTLTAPIQLKSQTNNLQRTFILQGEGQRMTKLHNNASTEAITLLAQKSMIRDLEITSDVTNAGNGINVALNSQNPLNEPGANYNTFSHLLIDNCNIGIQFVGACKGNHVMSCHILGNRSHGIDLESGIVNSVSYIPINNSFIQVNVEGNKGNQYNIGSGKCTSIANCEFMATKVNGGIYMDNADGTVISNVYCDSCGVYSPAIVGTAKCYRTIIIQGMFGNYAGDLSFVNPYTWLHGN